MLYHKYTNLNDDMLKLGNWDKFKLLLYLRTGISDIINKGVTFVAVLRCLQTVSVQ